MQINATIFGQLISFVLFVMFCMKYIWPPIISAIEKRQEKIFNGIKLADQAKKDLELAKITSYKYIQKAKEQAQEIIDQANKKKINIIDNIKIEAEIERKKIINKAYKQIQIEKKYMVNDLKKVFTNLVISASEKIIEKNIDISTQNDIINKFISKLE